VSVPFRVVACLAFAFAFLPHQAAAQSAHGVANTTCQQFNRAARANDILYIQASNWLLGYVSGMNSALKASGSTSAVIALGNDELMNSAGRYCDANPQKTIANAAAEWYPTLPRQAEAPQPQQQQSQRPSGWTIDLNQAPRSRPGLDMKR
jgi:hypothetical protein